MSDFGVGLSLEAECQVKMSGREIEGAFCDLKTIKGFPYGPENVRGKCGFRFVEE